MPYPLAWTVGWLNTAYATHVSKKSPRVPLEAVKMSKRFMYFDSEKAVRELGWRPSPIETAVSDALEWFAENGYFSPNEVSYGRTHETDHRHRLIHHEAEVDGR
jgi:dihydroflavonol-4-reductase